MIRVFIRSLLVRAKRLNHDIRLHYRLNANFQFGDDDGSREGETKRSVNELVVRIWDREDGGVG